MGLDKIGHKITLFVVLPTVTQDCELTRLIAVNPFTGILNSLQVFLKGNRFNQQVRNFGKSWSD